MGLSSMKEQRDKIVDSIRQITRGDWKILIVDEDSKKILDSVVKEDDILNENITNIERIEDKRENQPDTDAIYFLSPEPHIVDCLLADFERRKYKKAHLLWTALLDPLLRRRFDGSRNAREQLASFETLSIDFFPRESHLITFRDPWSFPILYHQECNGLVRDHLQSLVQKITGICVLLGEYPKVRYYKPRNPTHEANVLCTHLARMVQEELDAYAGFNQNFPPPSSRPQGILLITDRAMDLAAPLVHEFTYQAMAHDLLPIKEGDKVLYKTIVHQGQPDEEVKDMEIGEKDKIWVDNRHRHMKDTIDKLMGDFQKFIADNPHFTNQEGDATSLNAIKDMLAGLPQFQELKEAYSLHLTMAQECMNIFESNKLPDVAATEQDLATGLDEYCRKPKNIAEQLVKLLDDEGVTHGDRLRLILLYILYRDGLIPEDIRMLLAHASLPPAQEQLITNLDLLGARTTKALKENRLPPTPLFPRKTAPTPENEEYPLSRFEPNLKLMLDEVVRGTLPQDAFPYVNPPLDNSEELAAQAQTSLRSAKPTWARNRMSTVESRQRIIVFMAGGATYSESRACYEPFDYPALFTRQVADLTAPRRSLGLPVDRPKKKAPDHLFARNDPPRPAPGRAPGSGQSFGLPANPGRSGGLPGNPAPSGGQPRPYDPKLVNGMANMSMSSSQPAPSYPAKLEKQNKYDGGEEEKKKKKGLFHRSKK
ncbi:Sec1 family superfamily protein [Bisporella sp. PMI_857]|nr:Sec1 family superfamily protein [Bisporella sp. PMI_857]